LVVGNIDLPLKRVVEDASFDVFVLDDVLPLLLQPAATTTTSAPAATSARVRPGLSVRLSLPMVSPRW
jgi:hypothetical protein